MANAFEKDILRQIEACSGDLPFILVCPSDNSSNDISTVTGLSSRQSYGNISRRPRTSKFKLQPRAISSREQSTLFDSRPADSGNKENILGDTSPFDSSALGSEEDELLPLQFISVPRSIGLKPRARHQMRECLKNDFLLENAPKLPSFGGETYPISLKPRLEARTPESKVSFVFRDFGA